jgi:hypothetical protein
MQSLERCSNSTFRIQDVCFDAMPVDERFDEIDPELEVIAQRLQPLRRPQQSMVRVHPHSAILSIAPESIGKIEGWIIADRRSVNLIAEFP